MSKTRNKSGSEVEHLRGEVRFYKSVVKSLKQRLRQYEKKDHFYDEIQYTPPQEPEPIPEGTCPDCGKGELIETDLKFLIVASCELCGYKEKRNLDGSKKEKEILPEHRNKKGSKGP